MASQQIKCGADVIVISHYHALGSYSDSVQGKKVSGKVAKIEQQKSQIKFILDNGLIVKTETKPNNDNAYLVRAIGNNPITSQRVSCYLVLTDSEMAQRADKS